MDNNFDVIVIGSGPGGYVCAIRCAQLGLKTAFVESSKTLGGTCLNVGCIPSKSLLNSSEMYHMANHKFGNLGIETKAIKLNLPQMMKNKEKSILTLTKGIEFLFKKNKITHLKGKGLISDKDTVTVIDDSGKKTQYKTKNIVIGTGSITTSLPGIPVADLGIYQLRFRPLPTLRGTHSLGRLFLRRVRELSDAGMAGVRLDRRASEGFRGQQRIKKRTVRWPIQ